MKRKGSKQLDIVVQTVLTDVFFWLLAPVREERRALFHLAALSMLQVFKAKPCDS